MTMVVAMSYSSKLELTRATRLIAEEVKKGTFKPEEITEQTIRIIQGHCQLPEPPAPFRKD